MTTPRTLADWLAHCDRMHPSSMDLSLERTVEVRRRLGLAFAVPVIVVAGTNGKGSTCALIESIARHAGYRTGLYQKPELVHFEERCKLDGVPVAAEALLPHFEAVEAARGEITLTKFEFTTLAIARLLAQSPADLVILEVGLGGRYDAVNAFDADAVVITSIDLDHMEWLGPDRESIGLEKAQVMRPGVPAIVSDPLPPASVVRHAEAIGADLWLVGRDYNHAGDRQQWGWSGRGRRYTGLAYPALRGANQLLNASGAIAVLESLRGRLPITAQAVRNGLATVELPGRFQVLPGQPALVLDVAHNPQAAAVLARNLDAMGFYPRTLAVFGAMRDKDIPAVLAPLARGRCRCRPATPRRTHCVPRGRPRSPPIESWSSDPSTPWAACSGTGCPGRPRSSRAPEGSARRVRQTAMAAPADDPATLQQARARARRRLIGAVVLLAIGVIVFPILFETRPRALSPDIPITVSRKDSGTVVTAPASSPRPPAPVPPPPDAGNEGEGAVDAKAAASSPVAPGPVAASAPETEAAATPPRAEPRPEPKADTKPAAAAEPKADAKADRKPDAKADQRPDDKQEAKPKPEPPKAAAAEASAPAKTGRYVVQVGAFTDALAVREARQKVEKLGLKTYTQEVDTPTGRRTRVRVGPFETKAEADAAGAKLKGAGLPVYLLLL